MFYELKETKNFNGTDTYLDLSGKLHYFLQNKAFSADIGFCTENPGYLTILAVYFKESFFPNFSLGLAKGRVLLSIRRGGEQKLLRGSRALCDGCHHILSFRGSNEGIHVYVDGREEITDLREGPWCEFGYVGFATVGRGTLQDRYADFFQGTMDHIVLSQSLMPLPEVCSTDGLPGKPLFEKGMLGIENFRIPTLVTLKGGITVASADARMEAPGDNPNHICRAIRISRDSGETWEPLRILYDYGGIGREEGASAIDGSLLYDEEEDILFMLFSHTPAGIGSALSEAGTGFDEKGRKRLTDPEGKFYYADRDGELKSEDGTPFGMRMDPMGWLWKDGRRIGSVSCGSDRFLREANTSFLQIVESRDRGETWTQPRDLNPQVKREQMRFLGAGPGTGIQLRRGPHKGRLVYPVYYASAAATVTSSAAIYSDDHGKTWKLGKSVNDGRLLKGRVLDSMALDLPEAGLGECQITELADGKLCMFLRNSLGKYTGRAESTDGGESWEHFRLDESLPDPQCQSHILKVRYEDRDAWLFSNPGDQTGRVRGTVRISLDGLESWQASRLIEPGEFGYSCMTQLPDGQIGILYEGAEITQYFKKFPLEWLLEEKTCKLKSENRFSHI